LTGQIRLAAGKRLYGALVILASDSMVVRIAWILTNRLGTESAYSRSSISIQYLITNPPQALNGSSQDLLSGCSGDHTPPMWKIQ
jgi:hypothetical protein